MSDTLNYHIENQIGVLTLNRPEARNALTMDMYDRIREICAAPDLGGDVKALIITGAGEQAFAAGTDIAHFRDFKTEEDAFAYEARVETTLQAIETCPIPTIAAISGFCTGGGATIAIACDLRIATQNSVFGIPVARTLGNCLSLANYARLVALIGAGPAMDMILTARLSDARAAQSLGLISEILPDHPALIARAQELAAMIASHAPLTIRATKEALRRLREGRKDDKDLLKMCYMSEDFREGMEAFLGKRKPQWQGR